MTKEDIASKKNNVEHRDYIPSQIANFFLAKPVHDIDNLKLNKLVYIAYGWCLVYKIKLFEETIQAWKFGPVIPSLYHEFKVFGFRVINRLSYFKDPLENEEIYLNIEEDDKDVLEILEQVHIKYNKKFSAVDLVRLTHKAGTPWHKTYKKGAFNLRIKDDDIIEYFNGLRNGTK
ncbi:hypothetical protein COTS27_01656 [Spirochaetota bacterium]|nr:hypothetical protein COTS27_01656 [Spirochaetota bacterium]